MSRLTAGKTGQATAAKSNRKTDTEGGNGSRDLIANFSFGFFLFCFACLLAGRRKNNFSLKLAQRHWATSAIGLI